MADHAVRLSSFEQVGERVIAQLRLGRHTALIGSSGSGVTTLLRDLTGHLLQGGFEVVHFDAHAQAVGEILKQANELGAAGRARVLIVDHAAKLLAEDLAACLSGIHRRAADTGSLCLWCGPLDARQIDRALEIKICSVPASHISVPLLPRDEQLAAYRAIADANGCRWGEAILYLMLDLCNSDLALASSATRYFHGDWSHRLYDETVWDRVRDWTENDGVVDQYRSRLQRLPAEAKSMLELIRFGGKPNCARAEILEEVNDALRRLCLEGFLVQNLLPGFYQLRNLTLRFLLDNSSPPELLFRRATNERAAQLLQDAETMLRQVLAWAFERIGPEAARERLEKLQQPGELIDSELNRDLLKWARENCSGEAVARLNDLLLGHRKRFKAARSAWAGVTQLMHEEGIPDDGRLHIHSIDYLTLNELATLVLERIEDIFPNVKDDHSRKRLKERWEEGVAKIRRLRNQVAHLRNVGFQDMEDLVGTVEAMRHDVIGCGGWR